MNFKQPVYNKKGKVNRKPIEETPKMIIVPAYEARNTPERKKPEPIIAVKSPKKVTEINPISKKKRPRIRISDFNKPKEPIVIKEAFVQSQSTIEYDEHGLVNVKFK